MDLTPSLSRSPASPPNSYCPSEASSLDYPSPGSIAQQYGIASLYGEDSLCSMAPPQDPEIPLFALDAVSQAEWNQATAIHATSTSASMPTLPPTEYDPFGSFGPPMAPPYAQNMYTGHHHTQKSTSLADTNSPIVAHSRAPLAALTRSPLSFSLPSTSLPGHPMASRGTSEAPASGYAPSTEVSRFPSPHSVQAPYSAEPSNSYGASSNSAASNGYLPNDASVIWGQHTATQEPYYATAGGRPAQPKHLPAKNEKRRQPRKLTTKEEANFQCEVKGCGKLFSRSYNYKAHLETHDEKREYPFPCQVLDCAKKFVRKTDLQRHHQSVHMKERNHKCDYCGRLFARKDTLRRHMDDGCSKRFDIGTLDLRTGSSSNTADGAQNGLWRIR